MAQAHVNLSVVGEGHDIIGENDLNNKRKVNFNLDGSHHISVYQNETGHVVITIRRGTRSVTISKETMLQIFDLQETLIRCCSFIEA